MRYDLLTFLHLFVKFQEGFWGFTNGVNYMTFICLSNKSLAS